VAAPDRSLATEVVRVTEAAALASSRLMGRGDEEAADQAATDAMHEALMALAVDGTIRIGEGAAGEADKLYVGEKVGSGERPEVDVALLPLEGPTIIAKGEPNGISVIAMAENGGFLNVPNVYMEKIAVGCGLPPDVVDLDQEPARNLANLAQVKGMEVGDLVVCALDRPRHQELIAKTREAGARIMLIADGDVSGVIATTQPASGVDVYMGIGSAREGVLAAAALGCVGAQMQTRLVLRGDDDRNSAVQSGIEDFDLKYDIGDMAAGELTFAATGVTGGTLLSGVRTVNRGAVTQSMVLSSATGTLRYIETHHDFAAEAPFVPAKT
jgi:fructose-1,6-bisphosphatase II / sedoheptulose-1,7-bisphosphatase